MRHTVMTDPIDTALLPCPFCGGDARRITISDDEPENAGGDVICCTICQASSHVEFGRKENLVALWNRRAATQADTARQEGIALGLALAKAAPRYEQDCFDMMERKKDGSWIAEEDIPEPPIPPHVAAARVLLGTMDPAIWRAAIAAMKPILRADVHPSAWNSEYRIISAMRAALEQIAKGEG
jgi:Lar family restriction alleviation protein